MTVTRRSSLMHPRTLAAVTTVNTACPTMTMMFSCWQADWFMRAKPAVIAVVAIEFASEIAE